MLEIKQSRDYGKNERLHQRVNRVLIIEMICVRQLEFTDHCFRMPTDEPINRFVIYESKVRSSPRPKGHIEKHFSSHHLFGEKTLEATETGKMTVNKST